MIKATQSEWKKKAFYLVESKIILPRKFKKIEISGALPQDNHSVLLLQNHFSWWDGFIGSYVAYKYLNRSYHVMVQEDQLRQRPYFRYKGAFSIKKKSRQIFESLDYTNALLEDAANMVVVFPQGKLQSIHTRDITVEKGVCKLLEKIPENCQVLYNAVIVNFFESFKPSLHCHLFDCGIGKKIDISNFEAQLSAFHREAMENSVRR